METKPRFPLAVGLQVAADLVAAFKPAVDRIAVAGSIRRRKPMVGDVEILYIPRIEVRKDPADMFATVAINLVDERIAALESAGVLERRKNVNGSEMFGPKNKLMRHRATGIPVDLFSATAANWFNYLVCRTGPAASNTRICQSAQARGWKWNPYGPGFSRGDEVYAVTSEADVFNFVGLPVPILECEDCHCKGADVEETTCPYTEEIYNKVVPSTLCDKCYHERCMEI